MEIEIKIVKVVEYKTVVVGNELEARLIAAEIVKSLREKNPDEEYWFENEEILEIEDSE